MNNTDRERIIREAIAARQAEGWTIRSWETRNEDRKVCCPIGAVGPGFLNDVGLTYLDAGCDWVNSFAAAVDGCSSNPTYDPSAYALGLKFKEEFGL